MKPTHLSLTPRKAEGSQLSNQTSHGVVDNNPMGQSLPKEPPTPTRRGKFAKSILATSLIVSFYLIYWSFGKVSPILDRESRLNGELTRLNDSVTSMELSLDRQEQQQFETAYTNAMNRLFSTPQALSQWRESINQYAMENNMTLSLESGQPLDRVVGGHQIKVIPVIMHSKWQQSGNESSTPRYRSVLQFHHFLLQMEHHTRINGIEVTTDSGLIHQVTTHLELWSKEES